MSWLIRIFKYKTIDKNGDECWKTDLTMIVMVIIMFLVLAAIVTIELKPLIIGW